MRMNALSANDLLKQRFRMPRCVSLPGRRQRVRERWRSSRSPRRCCGHHPARHPATAATRAKCRRLRRVIPACATAPRTPRHAPRGLDRPSTSRAPQALAHAVLVPQAPNFRRRSGRRRAMSERPGPRGCQGQRGSRESSEPCRHRPSQRAYPPTPRPHGARRGPSTPNGAVVSAPCYGRPPRRPAALPNRGPLRPECCSSIATPLSALSWRGARHPRQRRRQWLRPLPNAAPRPPRRQRSATIPRPGLSNL
mmetsp:Transcript_116601/g.329783  ORF Transcript_116601/g.329783 Transcript_116601/m.329783 type:complete len:252 (+) Transcript_116601:1769-2524(+)